MSKPTTRRFQVPAGRVVVLPVGLLPGPNATNTRLEPGAVVELDLDRIARHDRYVNGRVRAGDLVELAAGDQPAEVPPLEMAPTPIADPKNPPAVTITAKE
jgi:hypothetical protein